VEVTTRCKPTTSEPQDAGVSVRYLIRDRDAKLPDPFDEILTNAGIAVVLTRIRIPRMNAAMERWVRTCRRELLDRMLIWDQAHLLQALREFEGHYTVLARPAKRP
jgi:transposase InsO family protein